MIEVMVAVGILAASLLALISILTFSFRAQIKSEKAHTASLIAKSLLNEAAHLLDENFDRSVLTPELPGSVLQEYQPGSEYKVRLQLEAETANLKRVEVEVVWEDQNGDQTETTMTKVLRSP